jgi:CRP-like cAMP-binding protein
MRPVCSTHAVPERHGCTSHAWLALESVGSTRTYAINQEIYGKDERAQEWLCIVTGAARKCLVLDDGRRRIVDFLLPHDFFGFGTRNAHHFSVEAVVQPTLVRSYPRDHVEQVAESHLDLQQTMQEITFEALSRAHARVLILGRVTAAQKVLAFLVEMSVRSFSVDRSIVTLPMARDDIADYLAISAETVSRALSELKRTRAITLIGIRQIKIADRHLH